MSTGCRIELSNTDSDIRVVRTRVGSLETLKIDAGKEAFHTEFLGTDMPEQILILAGLLQLIGRVDMSALTR